jgi:hypothetical protein
LTALAQRLADLAARPWWPDHGLTSPNHNNFLQNF